MLRPEAKVEANERHRTVQTSEPFMQHPTRELWIPVINRGEDHEHRATEDDVVEVGNHEVGVMHVDVEWHLGQCNSCDATQNEIHDESAGEQHGAVECDAPSPNRGKPVEEFDARGNGDECCGDGEEQSHPGWCSAGEHMVRPNNQSQPNNCHDRIHHRDVTEQWFASMHGENFADQSEGWQHHDVYSWMRIKPEKVLINNDISTQPWIEESCVSNNVKAEKYEGSSQYRC